MKHEQTNLLGAKVSPLTIAEWIQHANREFLAAALTGLLNPHYIILTDAGDGSGAASSDGEVIISPAGSQVTLDLRSVKGGGGLKAWHKQYKWEVDKTYNYSEQSTIHIQATDALVTTGIADKANPSGGLVQSCPGIWVATQAVPAAATISGTLCWNLPQWPMPNPLNYDDPLNFWIYLGEVPSLIVVT